MTEFVGVAAGLSFHIDYIVVDIVGKMVVVVESNYKQY